MASIILYKKALAFLPETCIMVLHFKTMIERAPTLRVIIA